MEADETFVVLRGALALGVHEAVRSVPAIVMVSSGRTTIVGQEVVLLVVAASEKLERTRITVITHSLQNHVVTLLESAETNVFHRLYERKSATVSSLGLLLKVHS